MEYIYESHYGNGIKQLGTANFTDVSEETVRHYKSNQVANDSDDETRTLYALSFRLMMYVTVFRRFHKFFS